MCVSITITITITIIIIISFTFSFFIYSDFTNLANHFLDESYALDQDDSIDLLRRPSKIFKHDGSKSASCIEMANSVQFQSYISHLSVQQLLTAVWTGPFLNELNYLDILIVLIFPPYLTCLKLRNNEKHPTIVSNDAILVR